MTWTSDYEPVEVGDTTFHELIAVTAARHGERVAVVDGASGAGVTYATLVARSERVAATLAARGFAPGDVLAVQAPNVPAWAGIALGAMVAGGAVTGVSAVCTAAELERQLIDSGASRLVTAGDIGPALIAEAGPAPWPSVRPDAVALLPYSSGTSGLPKGVMLTHANLVTAVRQLSRGLRLTAADVVLALAPFSHVMGFVVTLGSALAAGAKVVTLPRFDVEAFLAVLERHRVTV